MFPLAFVAGSLQVTDEALLADTTSYDPSSLVWMFSLLLKELNFDFDIPLNV